jgi:hypothetical protein
MNIFASDVSGMAPLVFVVPVFFVMAVASYLPSARGHWSGPAHAAPLGLAALAFILLQSGPHSLMEIDAFLWAILLLPIALAGGSIALWAVRRGSRAA